MNSLSILAGSSGYYHPRLAPLALFSPFALILCMLKKSDLPKTNVALLTKLTILHPRASGDLPFMFFYKSALSSEFDGDQTPLD
jgi:hypothetical protein